MCKEGTLKVTAVWLIFDCNTHYQIKLQKANGLTLKWKLYNFIFLTFLLQTKTAKLNWKQDQNKIKSSQFVLHFKAISNKTNWLKGCQIFKKKP